MTTKTDEQERRDFECFMSDGGKFPQAIERDANGNYVMMQAASSWHVWQARAALQSQDREDAQEIAATLATVLHFIPRNDEPELYADVERLCGEFGNHARRIGGGWGMICSGEDVPNGYVLLQRHNGKACYAACMSGTFAGWLMWKHPDGQWVSKRKLEAWELMQVEDQRDDGIVIETSGLVANGPRAG